MPAPGKDGKVLAKRYELYYDMFPVPEELRNLLLVTFSKCVEKGQGGNFFQVL